MSIIRFVVDVKVSEKVNDVEVTEIAENIREALINQVNTAGLTPEDSEAFTEEITINAPVNSGGIIGKRFI